MSLVAPAHVFLNFGGSPFDGPLFTRLTFEFGTAVPEPHAALLFALGFGVAGLLRRP